MSMKPGYLFLSVVLFGASAGMVQGQEYPTKAIRVITGSAGGGTDVTSRIITQGIAEPLGHPVIVDNRPALLGAVAVSKAPPDGYTLFISGSTFLILPFIQKVSFTPTKNAGIKPD